MIESIRRTQSTAKKEKPLERDSLRLLNLAGVFLALDVLLAAGQLTWLPGATGVPKEQLNPKETQPVEQRQIKLQWGSMDKYLNSSIALFFLGKEYNEITNQRVCQCEYNEYYIFRHTAANLMNLFMLQSHAI